jgi:hypothetical protein
MDKGGEWRNKSWEEKNGNAINLRGFLLGVK